jgi:hypothetical protein
VIQYQYGSRSLLPEVKQHSSFKNHHLLNGLLNQTLVRLQRTAKKSRTADLQSPKMLQVARMAA